MIPIGDSPRTHSTPWVNYALIVANVAVFIYMLTLDANIYVPGGLGRIAQQRNAQQQSDDLAASSCYTFHTSPTEVDRFYCRWSLQPREFFDAAKGQLNDVPRPQPRWEVLLSIVTSMFMHGGWLHIAGNMLFLWVFGDNVEDRLGKLGYLLFYLAAGVVAALVQSFADPGNVTPVVGASGAIAGILGAYIVWYPRATVNVIIPFFILIFIPLPIPAVIMIGLWFLQNLFTGLATVGNAAAPDQGVAWFAHIGGFIFGAMMVLLFFRNVRRQRPPPRWDDA